MYLLLPLWFFAYFLSVKLTILLGRGNLRNSLNLFFWPWIICNDFDFHKQAPSSRMKTFYKHKAGGSSTLWSFKCYLALIWLAGPLGLMLLLSFCDLIFDNFFFFSGVKSFPAIFVSSGRLRIYKQVKDSQEKCIWL